jgi:hypothetical protein
MKKKTENLAPRLPSVIPTGAGRLFLPLANASAGRAARWLRPEWVYGMEGSAFPFMIHLGWRPWPLRRAR